MVDDICRLVPAACGLFIVHTKQLVRFVRALTPRAAFETYIHTHSGASSCTHLRTSVCACMRLKLYRDASEFVHKLKGILPTSYTSEQDVDWHTITCTYIQ